MDEPVDPRKNQLLARLPEAQWQRWKPMLELVYLPLGKVLFEPGEPIAFVCFPTSGVVSMVYPTKEGMPPKIAVVGNEGVVGVSMFTGGDITSSRAVVQNAGMGYLIRTDNLKGDFDVAGPVMVTMLRYTQALIFQIRQTLVCNRLHSSEKQFCRWLLLSLDRLATSDLVVSEELVGKMLSVTTGTVIDEAMKLQAAGAIRYTHGKITVLDRPKVERRTCECYGFVKEGYEQLSPHQTRSEPAQMMQGPTPTP